MAADDSDDLEMLFEYEEEDSDSSTSDSDSEDDGEIGEFDEDVGEDVREEGAAGIAPYQHEPLPRQRDENEEENNGDARQIDPNRLNNMDW